jgi:hypothetical protein
LSSPTDTSRATGVPDGYYLLDTRADAKVRTNE